MNLPNELCCVNKYYSVLQQTGVLTTMGVNVASLLFKFMIGRLLTS